MTDPMGESRPKKWTPKQTEQFIAGAFRDRVSWTASRHLLVRLTNDEGWNGLDPELRSAIERFLEKHPLNQSAAAPR